MSDNPDLPKIITSPPALYIVAFIVAGICHLAYSWDISHSPIIIRLAGVVLAFISGAFARWTFFTMHSMGTSADLKKQSTKLATSGPFAITRNPLYVSMTGLYIGASALLNSWWPLSILVPVLIIMHWGVILPEEKYLSAHFGSVYESYKAKARRWL